jgi:hypothetical protein
MTASTWQQKLGRELGLVTNNKSSVLEKRKESIINLSGK